MLELLRRYSGITMKYCELLWITMNYSELLWITWIFYYIFSLGFWFFNWAILIFLLGYVYVMFFLGFLRHFYKLLNYHIFLLGYQFSYWGILVFLLGFVFWQLNRSEFLCITLNCFKLLVNWWIYSEWVWIAGITLNYFELLHNLAAVEGNINTWLKM
jgi:hypothetical protein